MKNETVQGAGQMKKFAIRKTETVKTTAAAYGGDCGTPIPWFPIIFL